MQFDSVFNILKIMKILLTLFVLLFSSSVVAEDISDFQIEGMSIGDSLLEYFSEEEIINSKRNYFQDERQYYVVGIFDDLKTFDAVDIYLKSNDKYYEIKTIAGKLIIEDKNQCLEKKEKITKEINILLDNMEVLNEVKNHDYDKSRKSKQYISQFNFGSILTHIRVECNIFSKKIKKDLNWEDTLNVVVMEEEISNWIFRGYE